MGIASVAVFYIVLEITYGYDYGYGDIFARWQTRWPNFPRLYGTFHPILTYGCMHICSWGSTREETLKFQGGITSQSVHINI